MREPKQALKEHYSVISKIYPEEKILGIFLYGSQNYGLATENSDVDSIAILVPSVEDIILKKPICKEIVFENGEHCNVKDIREIIKEWKKQSIQALEILFTDYFIINEGYISYWNNFLSIRNDIVHYDIERTFKSIAGQAKQTYLRNPSDKKQIANALRLYNFLKSYLTGYSYNVCLTSNNTAILNIKTGKTRLKEDAVRKIIFDSFDKLKDDTFWKIKSIPEIEEKIDRYLVNLIKGIDYERDFKFYFKGKRFI